ncbi:hypothetical protein CN166_00340 [Sinorhizobium medicae]|uniref:LssY C-terminal domain-containing protein n=1 Tax=Sinorhizobium medicae TaxID=110321 RepID=UPI000FD192D2|nr:LssY C-terminal domain-containing protein [Sinorhizobium medicae]MDX0831930.1 hypothetical protein [Sinorhizobium medicae]RVJ63784.1 hypothetical protein CN166_00340 [Sinorhizobium medicae]
MHLSSTARAALPALAALIAAYLLLAYFLVPEMWIFREHRLPHFDSMVTATADDIPGDPINVGLVGSKAQVMGAFAAAGWHAADAITWRSSIDIGLSVVLHRPDSAAPVSPLFYRGRKQDLAFEKAVGNSADQRHHVRFWQTDQSDNDGRPFWFGSVTFDRGVGLSHDTGQITHHIAADVDVERDGLIRDLQAAGQIASTYDIGGVGATMNGRNGGGDSYFTDGFALIGIVRAEPRTGKARANTSR